MLDQATRLREIAEQYCEQPRASKPHVITVASGKGGVGKSTVALNLAIRLAELGNKTIILDADDNLGNIDVMLGVSPKLRIADILRGERDIEEVLVSPLKNLSLLPGNSGDMKYPKMTTEKQRELLSDIAGLEERFDYLVIDTSAGVEQDVVGFAVQSHETLVITTPEPTAVMDAYALIKMILLADVMVPIKLIMNTARVPAEADTTAEKLQLAVKHFLNCYVQYLGSIPYDVNVSNAIMRQNAVVREFPLSGASLSLQMIAERVIEQAANTRVRRVRMT